MQQYRHQQQRERNPWQHHGSEHLNSHLFCSINISLSFCLSQQMVLDCKKQKQSFNTRVSLTAEAIFKHKRKREKMQEKLWIKISTNKAALSILSLSTHSYHLPSAFSSPLTLLPLIRTHNGPQGCQGDCNVILDCCHLFWTSTNEKGRESNGVKNKCVNCPQTGRMDRQQLREYDGIKRRKTSICCCCVLTGSGTFIMLVLESQISGV